MPSGFVAGDSGDEGGDGPRGGGADEITLLIDHGPTSHLGWGIAGAAIGIVGNQVVARYKLVVGRRINSATLIADARHSWLDALSSAGAMAGLIAVALGQPWGDPVAGLAVTAFICHVGYQVTADVARRLADGIDPSVITGAEAAAGSVPGVIHAHARARWTGRTLRIEIEGWVDPDCQSATPMNSAARSQPHWPGKFPTQEASPGPPALLLPEKEDASSQGARAGRRHGAARRSDIGDEDQGVTVPGVICSRPGSFPRQAALPGYHAQPRPEPVAPAARATLGVRSARGTQPGHGDGDEPANPGRRG